MAYMACNEVKVGRPVVDAFEQFAAHNVLFKVSPDGRVMVGVERRFGNSWVCQMRLDSQRNIEGIVANRPRS